MIPPALDGRLAAAAAFVRPGARMADIGCDHGKLSVHMAMMEKARYVIAVDARPQPLRKAWALAVRAKMEKRVECRLGDGLTALRPEEADDIVMAGISGVTAAEILAASPSFWQEDKRFIFVPASKTADLRRWLCGHGFKIEAERAAWAAGHIYAVLCARYTGEAEEKDGFFCALGALAEDESPEAESYRRKVLADMEIKYRGRRNDPRYTDEEKRELRELTERVRKTVEKP